MKLYYFPIAPNPTKVMVYLGEKRLGGAAPALELVLVDLREGAQKSAQHLARNPSGKLPVLELDDGSFLSESLPIIEYLEERYPAPVLIGSTPEERARVRSVERLVDTGVLMTGGRAVHATNSPLGLPPNPAVAEDAMAGAKRTLARIDALLAEAPFVAGDRVTIADCSLWAALNFMSFFGLETDAGFANVRRWREAFGKRPSVQIPEDLS